MGTWPGEYYYTVQQRNQDTGRWHTLLRGRTSKELHDYIHRVITTNRQGGSVRMAKMFDIVGYEGEKVSRIKEVVLYHDLDETFTT
jgi:hypothetical protein